MELRIPAKYDKVRSECQFSLRVTVNIKKIHKCDKDSEYSNEKSDGMFLFVNSEIFDIHVYFQLKFPCFSWKLRTDFQPNQIKFQPKSKPLIRLTPISIQKSAFGTLTANSSISLATHPSLAIFNEISNIHPLKLKQTQKKLQTKNSEPSINTMLN